MLRPPNEYESTRVNLSTRVVKINNLFFDRAVIFFVPKVADKGVDLASLQCTIVQVTDRGEWGKEEEEFTVNTSSFDNRKYREFDLNTDAEYSLKIVPPPELRMGILEIYFDPTILSSRTMGTFDNPVNVTTDFSPVIAAISASSAAEVAATQANTAVVGRKVVSETDSEYTPTVWSNTPANHVAVQPDPARFGGSFYNTGNKPLQIDKFLVLANKTPASQADGLLQPGGTYTFKVEEAHMGYLISALTTGGLPKVAINLQL